MQAALPHIYGHGCVIASHMWRMMLTYYTAAGSAFGAVLVVIMMVMYDKQDFVNEGSACALLSRDSLRKLQHLCTMNLSRSLTHLL